MVAVERMMMIISFVTIIAMRIFAVVSAVVAAAVTFLDGASCAEHQGDESNQNNNDFHSQILRLKLAPGGGGGHGV